MDYANVSREFHSLDELPGIWEGLKKYEKNELYFGLFPLMENTKKVENAFNFISETFKEFGIDSEERYYLFGKSRTSGAWDEFSTKRLEIQKRFGKGKQISSGLVLVIMHEISWTRIFYIHDLNFSNYNPKEAFDFSELYKSEEKIISEIDKFLNN